MNMSLHKGQTCVRTMCVCVQSIHVRKITRYYSCTHARIKESNSNTRTHTRDQRVKHTTCMHRYTDSININLQLFVYRRAYTHAVTIAMALTKLTCFAEKRERFMNTQPKIKLQNKKWRDLATLTGLHFCRCLCHRCGRYFFFFFFIRSSAFKTKMYNNLNHHHCRWCHRESGHLGNR